MSGLQSAPIKNFALGIYDGPHATPKEVDEGPVFLGIKNVTPEGRLDLSEIRHVSEQEYPKWTKRVTPQKDDVVFSYEATLHRYALIPEGFHGCLGRRMALVRPDQSKIIPRFLHYYFMSPAWRAVVEENIISGATVDRIPIKKFPDFEVSIPSLSKQRSISDTLTTYDDLIENNRRRIQLLEQAARLLYKEWFVRLRFPGHEHTQIIDGVPGGWSMRPIKDVVEGVYDGPHATPPDAEEGPIFLGIKNITESGRLDLTTTRHISEEDFPKWTRRVKPQAGDIVFSYEATLNLYALIPEGFRGCLGRRLALVRPIASDRTGLFIYFSFFVHRWRTVIEQNRLCGATVDRVPIARFPDFPLLMPPRRLIAAFDDHVLSLLKQMETLERENELLAKARDLLLPKLMNGEVVV